MWQSPMCFKEPGLGLVQDLEFLTYDFFFKCLFIFERERQSVSGGGAERERGTQNLKQAPGSRLQADSTEADVGLKLMSCEIMI